MTEDDELLWGREPTPEERTTLSQMHPEEGYQPLFVTDTLHQFRARPRALDQTTFRGYLIGRRKIGKR